MRTEAEVTRAIRIMEHLADSAAQKGDIVCAITANAVVRALKWTSGEDGGGFGATVDDLAKIQSSKSN